MFSTLTEIALADHKLGQKLADEEAAEEAAKQAAAKAAEPLPTPRLHPDSLALAFYHTDSSDSDSGDDGRGGAGGRRRHDVDAGDRAAAAAAAVQERPRTGILGGFTPPPPTPPPAQAARRATASRGRRRLPRYAVPRESRLHYPYDLPEAMHGGGHARYATHRRASVGLYDSPEGRTLQTTVSLRGWGPDTPGGDSQAMLKVEKALQMKKSLPPPLATAMTLALEIVDDVAAEGHDTEGAEQAAARLGITVGGNDDDGDGDGATTHTVPASPTSSPSPTLSPSPKAVHGFGVSAFSPIGGVLRPTAQRADSKEAEAAKAKAQEEEEAKAKAKAEREAAMSPEEREWRRKREERRAAAKDKGGAWKWKRKKVREEEEVYDMLKLSAGGGMTPSTEMVKQRRFWRPGMQGTVSAAATMVVEGMDGGGGDTGAGGGAGAGGALGKSGEDDIGEAGRDWNEEYQRLVDIVPLSKFEADERQSAINKLAADYSKHCCAVVKRLVQARGSGGALKVIGARQIGQHRFKDFYLHHRVLYWLLSDNGMLGSMEFAYKAASKECSYGMELLGTGIPGIHPLLSVAVDFLGRRVLCIAVAPVDDTKETLVAGSTDAARNTFFSPEAAKREYVTELCEQLSRSLHVAKHNVVGKAAWLPADATMHISKTDGRLYATNLWRMMPAVRPLREMTILCRVIHDDSHGSSAYDGDSDGSSHNSGYMSDNDRPIIDPLLDTAAAAGVTMSALRFSPPLLRPGDPHISNPKVLHALLAGAKDLLHADPRSMEVRAVHGGRLIMVCLRRQRHAEGEAPFNARSMPMNTRASTLARRRIGGPALVVSARATFVGRPWLYQFMRPEFLRKKLLGRIQTLNPDASTGFCDPQFADYDASIIEAATSHLESAGLDELLEELEESLPTLEKANPGARSQPLKELFHKHGVNLRYLGSVRRRSKSPRLRELLLCEMMARTLRLRVNRALRHGGTSGATISSLKSRVAKAFNAMFGVSGEGSGGKRRPGGRRMQDLLNPSARKPLGSGQVSTVLGRGVRSTPIRQPSRGINASAYLATLSPRSDESPPPPPSDTPSTESPSPPALHHSLQPAPSGVLYDLVDTYEEHKNQQRRAASRRHGKRTTAVEAWSKAFVRDPEFAFKEALWQLFPDGLSPAELTSRASLWAVLSTKGKSRAFYRACELVGATLTTPMFSTVGDNPLTGDDVYILKPRAKLLALKHVRGPITTAIDTPSRLNRAVEYLEKEAASREEALGAGKEHVIRAQLALGQALSEREDTWRRAERVLTDAWTMVERLAGLVSLVESPITIGGSGSKGATDAEAKAEDPMTPDIGQLAYDVGLSLGRLHHAKSKVLPTSSARVASDRAIGMFKRCDEVACKAFGERSLQRADIANELGTMLTEYNMLKAAEEQLFLASSIREEVLGDRHPDCATTIFNLATVYDKLKLYNKATPLYLQARNLRHLKLGNNSPAYSATLVRLVHVYKKLEKETGLNL